MTIDQIAFFNHYHNGDLFHSKAFVTDLMHQLKDLKFSYYHGKDVRVLADLDIPQFDINRLDINSKSQLVHGNLNGKSTLFINTWIGAYFELLGDGQCSLRFTYRMWKHIHDVMNKTFDLKIQTDDIEEYWSVIDYRRYHTANIDDFVDLYKDKKLILVCNGPGQSGQCSFNGDMTQEIESLAEKYSDRVFITTSRVSISMTNVFHSDNITRVTPDLNEISYLSQFCDLIIGRSSGPFCFSTTKKNVNDPTKTFFCFGDNEKDSYPYDMPTKARYIFHKYVDQKTLVTEISNIIGEKTHVILD
jgi:hypothetical protein